MSSTIARAVLLVGSAKPEGKSTSQALGQYLLDRLHDAGASTQLFLVNHARDGARMHELLAAVDAADLFVLCSPVYVDSLPSLVMRAFEQIAAHRRAQATPSDTRFMTLLNCGFPESRHCRSALDISRIFSQHARFRWAGGLALGGGEIIHGTPLVEVGSVGRRVRQALDETAASLLTGSDVPEVAVKRMAKPLVPTQMYTLMGNFGWRQKARKNHVAGQLRATPFSPRT
jgi:hypothetical protein